MEVRADKFLSGHYAYFVELPERKQSLEKLVVFAIEKDTSAFEKEKLVDYAAKQNPQSNYKS